MLQRGTRENALEYSDERKEAKIMCHRKKKEYQNNIIQKLQHRYSRNVQKLYGGVSIFKREFKSRIKVCRDMTGNIIFGEQHIMNIWGEYVGGPLSGKAMQSLNVETVCHGPELRTSAATVTEVYSAIFFPLAPTLEHRADFSVSLIVFTDGRTPWTGDQLVARSLPKHRTTQIQNKRIHTLNIYALCWIRTHDPGFRVSEDIICLRPLCYRDRHGANRRMKITGLLARMQ
jgi:hypothetical protein